MPPIRTLRLLPTITADGATQMAWDEALLESAAAPTLRLYRWQPAAVSLGYFQDHAPVRAALTAGRANVDMVRRITGGGAIWHEHEVTYALVGMLGAGGLPERTRDIYPLLHGAILAALAARGAVLARQHQTVGDRRYRDEPRCFASPAVDDLVHAAGGKALGSAARARGERVLVHGSLKLATNPWDGAAVAPCGLAWDGAAAALRDGLLAALDAGAADDEPSAAEQSTMERIRAQRYGDDGWVTGRRGPRP